MGEIAWQASMGVHVLARLTEGRTTSCSKSVPRMTTFGIAAIVLAAGEQLVDIVMC
jgi:hypothetical protein